MNQDVFEGKWKQIKGSIKTWWNELTDDDIDAIDGRRERLYGVLQERYGWARERAEQEVNNRLHDFETTPTR